MTAFTANGISIVLFMISAVHLYWAFGGLWPGRDPQSLAAAVIGDPRLKRLPPAHVTATVAFMVALAAAWPVVAPRLPVPAPLVAVGSSLLALIFIARGIAGYIGFFRRRHSLRPFATWNRWFYSPLCFLMGGSFLYLAAAQGLS